MTYDPYRNKRPHDPYPRDAYNDARDLNAGSGGASILLAALLLAAIGGFIFFYAGPDEQSVAVNDTRPQITESSTTGSGPSAETTGSSANMPPAPEPKLEPRVKPLE